MVLRNLDMVVWMSGFHNPLVHTDFNMFVDEWTSANESPATFSNLLDQSGLRSANRSWPVFQPDKK